MLPHIYFVRVNPKIKNVTLPFVYCGKLIYHSHEEKTSNPVHIIFQSVDYDDFTENDDLIDIYLMEPIKNRNENQFKNINEPRLFQIKRKRI